MLETWSDGKLLQDPATAQASTRMRKQGSLSAPPDQDLHVPDIRGRTTYSRQLTKVLLQEDIGEPVLEFDLEAGDLLYMPRGTIHQVR